MLGVSDIVVQLIGDTLRWWRLTVTVVMLALVTLPLPVPLVTVQGGLGLIGWVNTVTLYGMPLGTAVANAKAPAAEILRLSPPLLRNTSPEPVRPVTIPPMV
jgi:hypothetical protein